MEKRRATTSGATTTIPGRKRTRTSTHGDAMSTRGANLWGLAGRREMMEMRKLWQLRMPRR